jgi:hypothetical protein
MAPDPDSSGSHHWGDEYYGTKPVDKWPLRPHPLVAGLGKRLVSKAGLTAAINEALTRAHDVRGAAAGTPQATPREVKAEPVLVQSFGVQPQSLPIVVLAGYLGGCIEDDAERLWQVLFLDAAVSKWLAIPPHSVLLHDRHEDHTAAFGQRDILWVHADARLAEGDESTSKEAVFLSGDFMRAADYAASLTPLAPRADSGLLCEAITPGCCGPHTH